VGDAFEVLPKIIEAAKAFKAAHWWKTSVVNPEA
jgi:hypothetical protein